jgi:hypothetical protein
MAKTIKSIMKNIIFVGMHNKKDKTPLCSSTKTGKLIDKIINELPYPRLTQRTNLYDIEYLPTDVDMKWYYALGWHYRIRPDDNDVIVLLGAEVHKHFLRKKLTSIINVAHPASKRSTIEMFTYVKDVSELIIRELKK